MLTLGAQPNRPALGKFPGLGGWAELCAGHSCGRAPGLSLKNLQAAGEMCPDIRLGNQGQQGQGPEGREEMQLVGVEERRGQELCSLGWQGRLWRRGLGAGGGRVWTCGDGYRDYGAGKSRPRRGEGKGLEMQEPVQGKLGGSLSGKYI